MSLTLDEIFLLNISGVRFISVAGKRTLFVDNVDEIVAYDTRSFFTNLLGLQELRKYFHLTLRTDNLICSLSQLANTPSKEVHLKGSTLK